MTTNSHEKHFSDDHSSMRDDRRQRNPSTNSSTPNSSGGEKQFHFGNVNNERSGQNSRTSSLAESTTAPGQTPINTDGFSNYGDVIQYLQRAWIDHIGHENSRRANQTASVPAGNTSHTNETASSYHPKGSSQAHYSHHQSGQQQQYNQYSNQPYWNNYGNPRRSGSGNYNRNYSGGNNDSHWGNKSNRFPSHRSMNNLMNNSGNYQQQSQSSPPAQRRQGDQQQYYHSDQQPTHYKKNRSDHDRRANGYQNYQQTVSEYPSTSTGGQTNNVSEQSNITSTQSHPNQLNSYNR